MLEQLHSPVLVVPQEGGVMQEALLGDGLCITAKLDIAKAVICMHVYAAELDIPKAVHVWSLKSVKS